jgi:hypothetical protein
MKSFEHFLRDIYEKEKDEYGFEEWLHYLKRGEILQYAQDWMVESLTILVKENKLKL